MCRPLGRVFETGGLPDIRIILSAVVVLRFARLKAALHTGRKPIRNAIGLACAIAAIALVGVDGHSGLAQEQAKMKLAPPQVFQPPFPYSLGIVAQGKRIVYVAGPSRA